MLITCNMVLPRNAVKAQRSHQPSLLGLDTAIEMKLLLADLLIGHCVFSIMCFLCPMYECRLPRERIDAILDEGSPFLELSQLAGYDMYGG
jgi:hypothetical protein